MPQRPSGLETLQLALQLLRNIPRNRFVTSREMQERLATNGVERDLRTLQRQLDMLADAFDIERDIRSKPFGYKWKPHAETLSLPGLSASESLLFALGQAHLSHLLPTRAAREMRGFFEQAEDTLRRLELNGGKPAVSRERAWLKKVRVVPVTQPLLPPKIRDGVFDAVSNALFNDHWLSVDYVNASGKKVRARVMPLGLAQQGVRMFLVCRFEGYEEERTLALHRIQSARESSESFQRPAEFDLERFDKEGRFGFGEGKRIHVRLAVSDALRLILEETPLAEDQVIRRVRGKNIVTATVVESQQWYWWLRGQGEEVELATP